MSSSPAPSDRDAHVAATPSPRSALKRIALVAREMQRLYPFTRTQSSAKGRQALRCPLGHGLLESDGWCQECQRYPRSEFVDSGEEIESYAD